MLSSVANVFNDISENLGSNINLELKYIAAKKETGNPKLIFWEYFEIIQL